MNLRKSIPTSLFLLLLANSLYAADAGGLSFSHHDWQLVCDNTGACRAAGYQSDEVDTQPVSVLLMRQAGAKQAVSGQLMIGNYDNQDVIGKLPKNFDVTLKINNQVIGPVHINQDTLTADLPEHVVNALLTALSRPSKIEWLFGQQHWLLSDKGATAVLLKMDEFQHRLGTQGALIKKGPLNEDQVLPASPLPMVKAAAPQTHKPLPKLDLMQLSKQLLLTLQNDADDCSMLADNPNDIHLARLSDSKLLVSALCWRAAYNEGYGHWLINDTPPYQPVLVTNLADQYADDGTLSASQKGRGLGDCWSSERWVWDGQHFILTESSTTGMCKLIAPGGAWSLPTRVSKITQ